MNTPGLDSLMWSELWWAIWSSINTINFDELEWMLGRHAEFVEHIIPMTLLRNATKDHQGCDIPKKS